MKRLLAKFIEHLITDESGMLTKFFERRVRIYDMTDPNRLRVRLIAAYFCIPIWLTKILMEFGVHTGQFSRTKYHYKLNETSAR